jgi:hypothetical protein
MEPGRCLPASSGLMYCLSAVAVADPAQTGRTPFKVPAVPGRRSARSWPGPVCVRLPDQLASVAPVAGLVAGLAVRRGWRVQAPRPGLPRAAQAGAARAQPVGSARATRAVARRHRAAAGVVHTVPVVPVVPPVPRAQLRRRTLAAVAVAVAGLPVRSTAQVAVAAK